MNQTFGPPTYRSQPLSSPSSICSNDSQDQSDKSDIESTDEDDLTVVDTLSHVTRPSPSPPQWNKFPPKGTTSKAGASRPTFSKRRLAFFRLQARYPRVSALLSRNGLDVNQRLIVGDFVTTHKNLVGDQLTEIYGDTTSPPPSILDLVPSSWKTSQLPEELLEVGARFRQSDRPELTTSPRDSKPTKCNDRPLHWVYDQSQTLAHIKECGDTRDLATPQVPHGQYPLPPRASVLAPSPRTSAFASLAATPAPSTQPLTASHSTFTRGQTPVTTLHSVPGTYIPKLFWTCPWYQKDPIGHHNCRSYKAKRIDSVLRHHANEKHADDLTPEIKSRINAIGRQPSAEARWNAIYMAIHGDDPANVPSGYWTESTQDLEVKEVVNRNLESARVSGLGPQQFVHEMQELAFKEWQENNATIYARYARMLHIACTVAPLLVNGGHNTHPGPIPSSESVIDFNLGPYMVPNSNVANGVPYGWRASSSSMEQAVPSLNDIQEPFFEPFHQDNTVWPPVNYSYNPFSLTSPQLGQSVPSYIPPAEVQLSDTNTLGSLNVTPPSTHRSDSSGDPKAPSPDSGYVSEPNFG
ncbi:hypothetical protein PV10_02568 [Exophiala mesophila]|uniref:Uncharacterized protein n=1 Tax=Exophiala mesophila TaxID=212818 RepID=A0A0D2A746_EXOME|nr:uncharacterized protein PV10_02568 [Exophiala mesophila]KIV94838.1 hypothetical protein PV10_02568 [Exophiala mesophila]